MEKILCYDSSGKPLKRLYQWDLNQTITVKKFSSPFRGASLDGSEPIGTPVQFGDNAEFHFCNRLSEEALVVVPTYDQTTFALTVSIPNILFQQPENITAYLYEEWLPDAAGMNSSRTTHRIEIPIVPRVMPSDYEYIENINAPSLWLQELIDRTNAAVAGAETVDIGLTQTADGADITTTDRNGNQTTAHISGSGGTPGTGLATATNQEVTEMLNEVFG